MGSSRSKQAVLVIDMQNDVVAAAHERDLVIANIGDVVERARSADVPVVWIQHNDDDLLAETPGWEIVSELVPSADEVLVRKSFRDSFRRTPLASELGRLGVETLIIAGAQTDYCVRWTLHSAQERGYSTVLVADGHTTDAEGGQGSPTGAQLIAHTNDVWASQADDDCHAAVIPAAQLSF